MSVRVCNRIRMTKKSNLFTGFAQGTHIVVLFETMYLHTAFLTFTANGKRQIHVESVSK